MFTVEVTKLVILDLLNKLNCNTSTYFRMYTESHRHYHTIEHIEDLMMKMFNANLYSDELAYAIMFHDIVYDPKSKTNEIDSVELMKSLCGYNKSHEIIYEAILSTADHVPIEGNDISKNLIDLDMDDLLFGISKKDMFQNFVSNEGNIFKEYSFLGQDEYKRLRIKFLTEVGVPQHYIDYIETNY